MGFSQGMGTVTFENLCRTCAKLWEYFGHPPLRITDIDAFMSSTFSSEPVLLEAGRVAICK